MRRTCSRSLCSYQVSFRVLIFYLYFILVSFYIHVSCLTVYVYYVYFVYDVFNNNNNNNSRCRRRNLRGDAGSGPLTFCSGGRIPHFISTPRAWSPHFSDQSYSTGHCIPSPATAGAHPSIVWRHGDACMRTICLKWSRDSENKRSRTRSLLLCITPLNHTYGA